MLKWGMPGRGTLVNRIAGVRGRDEATAIGNGAQAAFGYAPRNIVDPKTMWAKEKGTPMSLAVVTVQPCLRGVR